MKYHILSKRFEKIYIEYLKILTTIIKIIESLLFNGFIPLNSNIKTIMGSHHNRLVKSGEEFLNVFD